MVVSVCRYVGVAQRAMIKALSDHSNEKPRRNNQMCLPCDALNDCKWFDGGGGGGNAKILYQMIVAAHQTMNMYHFYIHIARVLLFFSSIFSCAKQLEMKVASIA